MASVISIRLPENLSKKLENIAKSTERSKSYLIRKAIEQYLEEYADYLVALERLNDISDEIVSGKELRKRLAL